MVETGDRAQEEAAGEDGYRFAGGAFLIILVTPRERGRAVVWPVESRRDRADEEQLGEVRSRSAGNAFPAHPRETQRGSSDMARWVSRRYGTGDGTEQETAGKVRSRFAGDAFPAHPCETQRGSSAVAGCKG